MSKLRFLMEENTIYNQESEDKINEVIQNALKTDALQETPDYLKLKNIIDSLTLVG